MAAAKDPLDRSKRPDLAGQTVYDSKTGMNVTYDDRGYYQGASAVGKTPNSVYRAPSKDAASSGGTRSDYGGSSYDQSHFSDGELQYADDLRQQAAVGNISWEQAHNLVEQIRNQYGYSGGTAGDQYSRLDGVNGVWSNGTHAGGEVIGDVGRFWGDGGSGGYGSASGGTSGGGGFGATDLTSYLEEMYRQNMEAELAALKSTYEQNAADLEAQAEEIPETYQASRNETAAQNDLARQSFNEYAVVRGLNTGTSGQAALASSEVLQRNLAEISGREADALAENALEQERLAIAYRNAVQQAQATGNSALAQALYEEYVRQDQAAQEAARLAQEQENWQAQFDFTQRQYDDSLGADSQNAAYNLAMTMLEAGLMPDSSTLAAAGISSGDALQIRQALLQGQRAPASASSGTGSGGGNRTSSSSAGTGTASGAGGEEENAIVSMNPSYFNAFAQSLAAQLAASNQTTQQGRVNLNAALGNINSQWNNLSAEQQQEIIQLLDRFGIAYNP